jgi:RHS repeat-associated protein
MTSRLRRFITQVSARVRQALPPRSVRVLLTSALLSLLLFTTLAEPFAANLRLFSWAQPAQAAPAADKPNRPDPNYGAKTVPPKDIKPAVPPPANTPVPPAQILRHTAGALPAPATIPLTTSATHFVSSDKQLTLDLPANAVTSADINAAEGHALSLRVTQTAPASGSIAGGSGLISFGSYLLQVVDGSGALATQGLRAPVNAKFRPSAKANTALPLSKALLIINGALPSGAQVAPVSFTPPTTHGPLQGDGPGGSAIYPNIADRAAMRMGALSSATPSVDRATNSLVTPLTLGDPSTTLTFNTHSPVAAFGSPDPFTTSLSSGALVGSLPINLPPAPGGTLPPVQLSYSSAEVSERHNVQASASWVGEGWSLGLGAVTWSEHNVIPPSGSPLWESSWQLSDPFGTGSEIIPDNFNMSTYYDDTPYSYCVMSGGSCTYPGWPKSSWRTADGKYTKIVSYVSLMTLPTMPPAPPCFRAWLTNGVMEEFGCTSDSLQFYYEPGNGDHVTAWYLDLITDPEGNQIRFTYQQTTATNSGITYPRDVVLSKIEYDDPGCHDAQTRCASWNPLAQILFNASHAPTRLTNSPTGCNTGTNLRCDNPLDLSPTNLAAPQIQSTSVLNDIQVQTRNGVGNPWNTLRDYQLSYEQSGPSTIIDPATGKQISTSGRMLLTQYKDVGDDGTTALPVRTFGYANVTQYYEDSGYHPNPTNNCGPAFNTGNGSGCLLWSQSYEGNSYYLSTADNGLGLRSLFSWDNARSNKHGVNGGGFDNTRNPLYCNTLSPALQATYPCNATDDEDWSRATVSLRRQQHYRAASSGNVLIDSQYTYIYFLTYPLAAQECPDCVAGFSWGNQNDGDYLDYYNGHYMGFSEVSEYFPDGSKIGHRYYATEGWGIYDTGQVGCFSAFTCHNAPYWHLGTAAHGMEIEASYYDTDNATLLKQEKSQYLLACPPPNVSATPPYTSPNYGNWNGNRVSGLDHNNPVAVCSVLPSQQDSFQFDGGAAWKIPQSTTTYAYEGNNYRRLTDVTTANAAGLKAEYYDNLDLTNLKVTRLDPTIDYDWGTGSPDPSIGVDTFSARWTGKVTPQTSETYTFYTTSDDGVRLWVNGTQIINNWTDHGPTENSGTIALTAGVPVDIKLEYYENGGGATIHLSWSSPSVAKQAVPQSALSVTSNGAGLKGEYYDNMDLTALTVTRLDPTVNFNWGNGSPDPSIGPDTFSARWTGKITAQTSETYTFYTISNDGVRLWVNGTQIINNWTDHAATENSGTIALTAGQPVDIQLEYYESATSAQISLSWSSASVAKQIVPSSAFALNSTGSPDQLVSHTDYIWNDNITATLNSATGTYLIDFPANQYTRDLANLTHFSCSQTSYDTAAYATGQQTSLSKGEATTSDTYTGCGYSPNFTPTGQLRSTTVYDVYGQVVAGKDPDANAGVSGHVGCTVSSVQYTACTTYDSVYKTLPVSNANALNQSASTAYTNNAGGGFGFWPTSATDPNGQLTSVTYDALGRNTSSTLPGEGTGLTTTSTTYTVWCSATGAQAPCVEVDGTQRLDSGNTVTQRSFYDGLGRLVETRTPAPNGQDVVRYTFYDSSDHPYFASNAYFVTAYTGAPGAAAFAAPDVNQVGSSSTYDALDREKQVTDPLSHITTTSYAAACGVVTGDFDCYEETKSVDANSHQDTSYVDGWGRAVYAKSYTGNSGGTYAVYATTKQAFDGNGHIVQITHPNGASLTTWTYDTAGRQTTMSDPDRGNETYTYDQNGNATQTVDARGSSGTIYAGYDGLNRQLWRNTTNSPTGAYTTYSYDSTASGNQGVGRRTGATFNGSLGPGSYAYTYDGRGQLTNTSLTVGGITYPLSATYNDAGQVLTQTYPTGETVTTAYTSQGWLASLTRTLSGTTTTLADNLAYTGPGGASGAITSARLGNNTYNETFGYDNGLRLTGVTLTKVSDGATLFASTPGYDAVNNVVSVSTTLPGGTDNQGFCYDEQDRLTWAATSGAKPCSGTVTAGTLTSAAYSQAFGYDTLNRLTSGPAGAYTYGDNAHLHAATAVGTGYTASYDAAGNMTCRAPTISLTCSGTITGYKLSYDKEGRLTSWQNAQTNPTITDGFLYDGDGNRIKQYSVVNGAGTTTVYVGGVVEYLYTGGTTTTTSYYQLGGQRIALAVNGTLSYLASDLLGSTTVALDGAGNVTASQLYAPYGTSRYSSGTMPTDRGFTGQHADATTGLDYYNARYYDPAVGQFASADTVFDGLNRYAYVGGNPETKVDPTGHKLIGCEFGDCGAPPPHDAGSGRGSLHRKPPHDAGTGRGSLHPKRPPHDAGTGRGSLHPKPKLRPNATGFSLLWSKHRNDPLDRPSVCLGPMGTDSTCSNMWVIVPVNTSQGVMLGTAPFNLACALFCEPSSGKGKGNVTRSFDGCGLSFSADTKVATPDGERAIGTLKVGDKVIDYDPKTGKTSEQTVEHVWLNHDDDLLDVILANDSGQTSIGADARSRREARHASLVNDGIGETIHTTEKHPWLTVDKGWLKAGELRLGEQVVQLGGTTATVVALRQRVGEQADYYNLTVSELHTYAVGTGQFVVHNCGGGGDVRDLAKSEIDASIADPHTQNSMTKRGFDKDEILDIIENGDARQTADITNGGPSNAQPATRFTDPGSGRSVTVNNATGKVIQVGDKGFVYDSYDDLADRLWP